MKPGAQIAASIAAGSREAAAERPGRGPVCAGPARPGPAVDRRPALDAPAKALTLVVGSVTAYLPLADLVDPAAERAKLNKELAEAEAQIDRSRSLLDGPFAQRAPANVVQRDREKLGELAERAPSVCANGWRNWGKIERAEAGGGSQPDGFDLKLGNVMNAVEERVYLRL